MAATLDRCLEEIRAIQGEARLTGKATRAHWPLIVLRTPEGWTGPAEVDGHKVDGFWRAHQVPLSGVHDRQPTAQNPAVGGGFASGRITV
jgi:xylulose-5-phosphate/fructose-6-phosphate phosphoketolase